MRNDIEAIGDLAGEALFAGGAFVKDMQEGIAGRTFGALGPAGTPVRVIHEGVSRAVFGGVGQTLRAVSRGAARLIAAHADAEAPALASRPGGAMALGALNGLYGNHLAARGNDLALGMSVRRDGADIPVEPDALAGALADATSRIVVFVHGLCETDDSWRVLPLRGERTERRTYGERLQDELSFTPVYLRYNTGLRVSESGRALAGLLDELVAGWPCSVEEIVLVGHSMGGLVARSACHYGEIEGRRWTDTVRHVFCLGTPQLGADLEKGSTSLDGLLAGCPKPGRWPTS